METEKWGVKIQNGNQKLVAAKWGGGVIDFKPPP